MQPHMRPVPGDLQSQRWILFLSEACPYTWRSLCFTCNPRAHRCTDSSCCPKWGLQSQQCFQLNWKPRLVGPPHGEEEFSGFPCSSFCLFLSTCLTGLHLQGRVGLQVRVPGNMVYGTSMGFLICWHSLLACAYNLSHLLGTGIPGGRG